MKGDASGELVPLCLSKYTVTAGKVMGLRWRARKELENWIESVQLRFNERDIRNDERMLVSVSRRYAEVT